MTAPSASTSGTVTARWAACRPGSPRPASRKSSTGSRGRAPPPGDACYTRWRSKSRPLMAKPKSPSGGKPKEARKQKALRAKLAYKGKSAFSTASVDPNAQKEIVALRAELEAEENEAAEGEQDRPEGFRIRSLLRFFTG